MTEDVRFPGEVVKEVWGSFRVMQSVTEESERTPSDEGLHGGGSGVCLSWQEIREPSPPTSCATSRYEEAAYDIHSTLYSQSYSTGYASVSSELGYMGCTDVDGDFNVLYLESLNANRVPLMLSRDASRNVELPPDLVVAGLEEEEELMWLPEEYLMPRGQMWVA